MFRPNTMIVLLMSATMLSGCGEDTNDEPSAATGEEMSSMETTGTTSALTYHRDIAPMMEENCNSCHSEGGIAPFALSTHAEVSALAQASLTSMETRSMPPWLPDPDCRELHNPRIMSPEAIDNKDTDYRADLWSLGCFLVQMLAGMPPFKGGSDYLTFK